jgi:hypothetical protein
MHILIGLGATVALFYFWLRGERLACIMMKIICAIGLGAILGLEIYARRLAYVGSCPRGDCRLVPWRCTPPLRDERLALSSRSISSTSNLVVACERTSSGPSSS